MNVAARFGFLALGFCLVVVSDSTCVPTKKCGPGACSGCCDTAGNCQVGVLSSACGANGQTCAVCAATQTCTGGFCNGGGSGGGSGGGGGGFGGGGGGGGGNTGPAFEQFCQSFGASYCDSLIACKMAEASARPDCLQVIDRYFCSSMRPSITKGYSSFDSSMGSACLNGIQGASTTCDWNVISTTCGTLVTPRAGDGQPCYSSTDCSVSGQSCGGAGCGKTCQASGGLGKPCSGSCDTGLWCDPGSNTCKAPQGPGGTCNSPYSSECNSATYCETATTHTCLPLPSAGQTCLTSYSTTPCAPGTFCDYAASPDTCTTRFAVGTSCSSNSSGCVETAFCDYSSYPSLCVAKKGAGGSCTYDQCASGLYCMNSVCTALGAAGASCQGYSGCQSQFSCDQVSRTCQTYVYNLNAGSACTGSTQNCSYSTHCKGAKENPDGGIGMVGTCAVPALYDACTGSAYECPTHAYCGDAGVCLGATTNNHCTYPSECLEGYTCNSFSQCAAYIALGQPCLTSTAPCTPPNVCRPSSVGSATGTCSELGGTGISCSTSGSSGTGCKIFFDCSTSTSTCVASGRSGQPCMSYGQCYLGACSGADGGSPGTCGPPRAAGQPCTSYMYECAGVCDGTTCQNACP